MSESSIIADGWSEWWDKLQEHGAIPAQETLLRLVFFAGAQHALMALLDDAECDIVFLPGIIDAMGAECHEFFKTLTEGRGIHRENRAVRNREGDKGRRGGRRWHMSSIWIARKKDDSFWMFAKQPKWDGNEWQPVDEEYNCINWRFLAEIKPGQCVRFDPTGFIYAHGKGGGT